VTRFLLSPQHHVGALARSQDLQQHTEGPPGWPLLLLRGANPTRSQPRRQGWRAPCVIKCSRKPKNLQTAPTIPLELQKPSVLQGFTSICLVSRAFVFVWRFVQVGWWAMIVNLNHYSGLFFSSEITGCPGATSTCLTSPSNRPMRTRKYAYSNCCYTTKFLWPLIYVYQPACGDSKWGYVTFMASKTCCSLD